MENKYMELAVKCAYKAYKKGEIPVGAVIVKNGKILSTSFNTRQKKYNILGHAEINAIIKAEKKTKDWRLDGTIMYVTLEPCEMCMNIIKESRIDKVVYLISNKRKFSTNIKNINIIQTNDCAIKDEYEQLIKKFFNNLRK